MRVRGVPVWGLALVSLFAACDRERQERPGETSVTSATLELVPNRLALDRVIAAQCMREQLCVEVGLAEEDSSSCADRVRTASCTGSIEAQRLEQCLQAIYESPCSVQLEARADADACRPPALCPAR